MYSGITAPKARRLPVESWGFRSVPPPCQHRQPLITGAHAVLATALCVKACKSFRLQKPRKFRQRSAKTLRKALTDDISQAVDEVGNTLEDAVLHFSRLPAWMSGRESTAEGSPPAGDGSDGRRKVVVLGTGWAAHAIAKIIDVSKVDVIVVSPRNYFIFTPMLAAASVGTVEYRSILEHIRSSNPTIGYCQGREQKHGAHNWHYNPYVNPI